MTTTRPPTPAPAPTTRPQVARFPRRPRLIFEPFWVVPAVWSVSAVTLGLALPQLDKGVPEFAVTMSFLLVLAAVGMFLAFIQHITQSIAVSTVIHRVGAQTVAITPRSVAGSTFARSADRSFLAAGCLLAQLKSSSPLRERLSSKK